MEIRLTSKACFALSCKKQIIENVVLENAFYNVSRTKKNSSVPERKNNVEPTRKEEETFT